MIWEFLFVSQTGKSLKCWFKISSAKVLPRLSRCLHFNSNHLWLSTKCALYFKHRKKNEFFFCFFCNSLCLVLRRIMYSATRYDIFLWMTFSICFVWKSLLNNRSFFVFLVASLITCDVERQVNFESSDRWDNKDEKRIRPFPKHKSSVCLFLSFRWKEISLFVSSSEPLLPYYTDIMIFYIEQKRWQQ